MFYVYQRNIQTGREDCISRAFDTQKEAITMIKRLYEIDYDDKSWGKYCYFVKQR